MCLRKKRARNSLVRLLLNVVDTLPSVGFLLEPSAVRGTHVCFLKVFYFVIL